MSSNLFKKLDFLESVDSTNDYLKSWIADRQPRVAVAGAQSEGRGRHGRSWESPAGQGLYVSYLLFPDWPQSRSPILNMIAALAVREGLVSFDPEIEEELRFKEPNDVLLAGKKVAGVLVELGILGASVQWAVVGVGVNLTQQSFRLAKPKVEPTSLLLSGRRPPPRPMQLCDALTAELARLYEIVDRGGHRRVESEFKAHVEERNR